MEYMRHGDLHRHLTHTLPEREAAQITVQVVEGLELMHRNRFVHRDLKPMVSAPPPASRQTAWLIHSRI